MSQLPNRSSCLLPPLDCTDAVFSRDSCIRRLQSAYGRCWQMEGQGSWLNPALALPGTCACLPQDGNLEAHLIPAICDPEPRVG